MSILDARKNFAIADVSTGYDDSATEIVLATGTGAKFPDPSTEGAFNLVWWDYTAFKSPSDDPNVEIVRCTARTGDVLTITRGQEGTTATGKQSGGTYKVMNAITKKMIDDIESNLGGGDVSNFELDLARKITGNSYMEFTETGGNVTNVDYWTDSGKGTKLFSKVITWTGVNPTEVVTTDEINGKILTTTIDWSVPTNPKVTEVVS